MQISTSSFLSPHIDLKIKNVSPLKSPSSSRFFKLESISTDKSTTTIISNLFNKKDFRVLWENTHKKLLLSAPIKVNSLSESTCILENVKSARFTYKTEGPLLSSLAIDYKDTLPETQIEHCIVYETINISFFPKYKALDRKLQNNQITKTEYFNEIYKIECLVAKKSDKLSPKLFPNNPELLYGENTLSTSSFIKHAEPQGHNKLIRSQANRITGIPVSHFFGVR